MDISQEARDRFDALLVGLEETHAGQCLLFNIADHTYAVAPIGKTTMAVHEAYERQYGTVESVEGPNKWRHFISNTVPFTRKAVKPGVYKHFKGNIYHVVGISENTETGEFSVAYIPQYGEHKGKLSNRPLKMFLEQVAGNKDMPEYQGPRFDLVEKRSFILSASFGEVARKPRKK